MDYKVCFGEQTVGIATVEKEGLYYFITCICHFSESEPYRLLLSGEKGIVDLGLCVSGKSIVKRMPIKSVGENDLKFSINKTHQDTKLYPLDDTIISFDIKKLPQASLRQKMGASYLLIKEDSDEG